MSKKLTVLIAGVVVSLALVAGTMQGCGSSSSGSSNTALCQQACDKVLMCTPDAGTVGMMADTMCKANCASQVSNTHCSNETAIANAVKACLAMPCDQLAACEATIPACQSTTGTGGTSGGGWTCQDDGQVCVCLQMTGGNIATCPSTYDCCFLFTTQGTTSCSCTSTAGTGATCPQLAQALMGTVKASCP